MKDVAGVAGMSADGGPAFPCDVTGMTLRDYFAAKAPISLADAVSMKAIRDIGNDVGVVQLAAALNAPSSSFNSAVFDMHTRLCYEWADAMLKAREA